MKKYIVFLTLLMLTVSAFGSTTAFDIKWGDQRTYSKLPGNTLRAWAEGMEGRVLSSTGDSYYVDTNITQEGDGSSWENAKNTLQEAIDLCTADNGDVIHVREGTTESVIVSGTITCDTAGVTFIGYGEGDQRPTITASTAATAKMLVTADDCYFYNFIFQSGKADLATVVLVTADDTTFESCSFRDSTSGLGMLTIGAADGDSDRFSVINCDFYQPGTTTDHSIEILFDMVGGVIANNKFYGDYDEGAIYIPAGGNACLDLTIYNNIVSNKQTGIAGISINGTSTTGVCQGNTIYTDTIATALDPGALMCFENYSVTGGDLSGILVPIEPAISAITRTAGSSEDILAKLYYASDGTDAYPATVVNDSTLAKIMASGATATASTFDNTTDSLQAISDKITAQTGYYYTGTNTAASTTAPVVALLSGYGDAYFVTDWVMICTYDAGGAAAAPEGEVRDITAYTSSTGTFTVDAFSAALASGDKVMVMRREMVAMLNLSGGTGNYPTGILDESVMAYIMGKGATASASTYVNTTDSLEAISDALAAGTGATTALEADNLDNLAAADTSIAADADLTSLIADGSFLSHIMTAGADTSDYAASTDSLEAISVALAAGTGATVAIDADQLDHLAGADTTVAADGDLTTYIVDGSSLSHLMTKGADTSDYQASTDSLEAIADELEYSVSVTRTAAATLANGTTNLFVVAGGPVEVTALVGIVTNTLKTVANDCKFIHTTTSPAGSVDLTSAVECSADATGVSYTLGATLGAALVPTDAGTVTSSALKFIAPAGTIGWNSAGTYDASDEIVFYIKYKPLVSGARVTAAP